jgi:hypothetical protein
MVPDGLLKAMPVTRSISNKSQALNHAVIVDMKYGALLQQ